MHTAKQRGDDEKLQSGSNPIACGRWLGGNITLSVRPFKPAFVQRTELFRKVGRNLELTEVGRLILPYAEEIFSLGGELEDAVHRLPPGRPQLFRVGVVNVVPKSIAHRLLEPALHMDDAVRMTCREADMDTLLAELAIHRLDLVLADRPIPPTVSTRGYSHKLGECPVTFFATRRLKKTLTGDFPQCLDGAPILLPSNGNQLRSDIDRWLDKHRLRPRMVAEFDDSALMKAFGQMCAGVFVAMSATGIPWILRKIDYHYAGWVAEGPSFDA